MANTREKKVYAWYLALFIVFTVALITVPLVSRYLRIGEDKRLVEERIRKANDMRKQSDHSRRGVQDERRKSYGRLRDGVEQRQKPKRVLAHSGVDANRTVYESGEYVDVFPDARAPVPKGYTVVGVGHITRNVEMPEFEVVSVRNTPAGMFTNIVMHEHVDEDGSKEGHWILVSQGLVLVNGRVITLVHFKNCESRSSAVADADRQGLFIQNWGAAIARENSKNK